MLQMRHMACVRLSVRASFCLYQYRSKIITGKNRKFRVWFIEAFGTLSLFGRLSCIWLAEWSDKLHHRLNRKYEHVLRAFTMIEVSFDKGDGLTLCFSNHECTDASKCSINTFSQKRKESHLLWSDSMAAMEIMGFMANRFQLATQSCLKGIRLIL